MNNIINITHITSCQSWDAQKSQTVTNVFGFDQWSGTIMAWNWDEGAWKPYKAE